MLDQKFKFVYIIYKESNNRRVGTFSLVTDIQYHNNYIVIEYYASPESTDTHVIMTDTIEKIDIEDMKELDAKREWVEMNNTICGHNFTQMKFWPFEGKKSEIHIYPLYGEQEDIYLIYTNVLGIERKWNHEIKGNELYIRTIDFRKHGGFHNIKNIIIVPEEDIKKFVIQRSDHEDLVINVNGGTYRDE